MNPLSDVTKALTGVLAERDDEIMALECALITSQHGVFLGPPGTGKTFMVDALFRTLKDMELFTALLHPQMGVEQLLGVQRVKKMIEDDVVEFNTAHKLPEAEGVFLDEVWNFNWGGLVSLNDIMQKRQFLNGDKMQVCPLVSLFGASNFMPREEGLEAVWDRFLIRMVVEDIKDGETWKNVVANPPSLGDVPELLDRQELEQHQEAAAAVTLSGTVMDKALELRQQLQALGITHTTRRWAKALGGEPPAPGLVKAVAYLQGRSEVTTDDLEALKWACWNHPGHIGEVEGVVVGMANPLRQAVREAEDMAYKVYEDAMAIVNEAFRERDAARASGETNLSSYSETATEAAVKALGPLKEAKLKLEELAATHDGKSGEVIESALSRVRGWSATLVDHAMP
jgi:MoxR-like ATPase